MKRLSLIVAAFVLTSCSTGSLEQPGEGGVRRIVSVGGSATEIIYALGEGSSIVGVDTSSIYPAEAAGLPQVGYQRQLSAEGVISLRPRLVFVLPEAGPPAALQQIADAGIEVVRLENESSVDGTKRKIERIAEKLGKIAEGEVLIKKMDSALAEAQDLVAGSASKPKAVFIYSRGSGSAQVGGRGTPADEMIRLAGAVNVFTDFENYKALTPEALIAADPDVVIVPERSLVPLGGVDGVLALPGISETKAGKARKVVAIEDTLLLGFTPRLGEGVKELWTKLHK